MAFWTSSMYRDLAKNRRIEADEIIDDLAKRGREAGIVPPAGHCL
jgi:ketopantoate reductase